MSSGRQVEVQFLRAGSHLAGELLVGEHTVSPQAPVVLDAGAASGQLGGDQQSWLRPATMGVRR